MTNFGRKKFILVQFMDEKVVVGQPVTKCYKQLPKQNVTSSQRKGRFSSKVYDDCTQTAGSGHTEHAILLSTFYSDLYTAARRSVGAGKKSKISAALVMDREKCRFAACLDLANAVAS